MLLNCVQKMVFKDENQPNAEFWREKIRLAYLEFFDPDVFGQKCFVHDYCKKMGGVLRLAWDFKIEKLPETQSKVIVDCIARLFDDQLEKGAELEIIITLERFFSWTFRWKIDPEQFHPTFWPKLFAYCEKNYADLYRTGERRANLLKNILVAVITFDRENDFEDLKTFWRRETSTNVDYFSFGRIKEIFSSTRQKKKVSQLESIISKEILEQFKMIYTYRRLNKRSLD